LRDGAADVYANAIAFLVANLVFGVGLFVLLAVWAAAGPVALLFTPLLALPWAVAVRVATLAVRREGAALSPAVRYVARNAGTILASAAVLVLVTFTFVTNLAIALQERGVVGLAFGGISVWGLVIEAMLTLAFWPVLLDPRRESLRARDKARLAGYVLFAVPVRLLLLAIVTAAILVLCVYVVALLPTIAIAVIAATATRVALPASDTVVRRARVASGAEPEDDEDEDTEADADED
jgi:hypothetical protein